MQYGRQKMNKLKEVNKYEWFFEGRRVCQRQGERKKNKKKNFKRDRAKIYIKKINNKRNII